jgi:hypothetical protein
MAGKNVVLGGLGLIREAGGPTPREAPRQKPEAPAKALRWRFRLVKIGLLALALGLVGCIGLDGPPSTEVARWQPRPHDVPRPGPDLRIPDNPVAQTTEVPLVPIPPVPTGRDAPPAAQVPPAAPLAHPGAPPIATTNPSPVAPSVPATPAVSPRQLHQQAVQSWSAIDSYIARLTRREQVNGQNKPEEVMLFKFRKEPWSVYFKWLGTAGQGREVIYVKNQFENKLHTLLAAGDAPLMPAGKRLSLPLDSFLVRSACRYPITEAGIGASIDRFGILLDAIDRGEKRFGTVQLLGSQARPEFSRPLLVVEQSIPPGSEPLLPRGGRRLYGFDQDSHLPLLVTTMDDRGQEVEYYCYDRLQYPVKLDADDFNPDKLWGQAKPNAH